jgi:hypothetical protein
MRIMGMNAFEFRRLNETIRSDVSYPRRLAEHHLENDKRLLVTNPLFKSPSYSSTYVMSSSFDTVLIKSRIVLLMNIISTLHSLLSNVIESTLSPGMKTLSVTAAVNDCSYSGRQQFQ